MTGTGCPLNLNSWAVGNWSRPLRNLPCLIYPLGEVQSMSDKPVEKKTLVQVVTDAFKELGETFVAFVKAPRPCGESTFPT